MRRLLLLAALSCCSVPAAFAQTAPVGFIEYKFAASGTAATYYLSAPLIAPIVFQGTVTTAGSNSLTVAAANWTANQFVQTSGSVPYYALVTSGTEMGRFLRITANTSTQLTVDVTDNSTQTTALTAPGFAISGTDSLQISAGTTIGSLFGNAANSVFPGSGTSFATAGGVGLWNAQTLGFDHYYYNTAVSHWVKDGASTATNTGDTVIPPSATVAVYLPAGYAGGMLVNSGRVVTVAPLLKDSGGNAVRYFGMFVPVDMTLSQINLGSNWTKSNSPFTADTLSVYNSGLAKWDTYYETSAGGWLKSGSATSQSATVIPGGSSIAFLKRASVSGSNSFLPITLPYTP